MTNDEAVGAGHRVQVSGAVKNYGSLTALSDIGFDVPAGQFMVLLGPSGSGKSTLIRALAGIERLDGGEIRLSGRLVSARGRHIPPERRNLAMVFQDYALWPHLSVEGNVAYALRRRRLDAPGARRRVLAALERVGLHTHATRYPHELSGGEQQRVALARAVVAEPSLLLFDEPLSNLDADLRERLRVEIATLTRECGATAVYITHDQSEAFALADNVGVLHRGALVQMSRPEDVYHRPATPFVAKFTGVAGEFTGAVVHQTDDGVTVQAPGATIKARAMDKLAIGDRAHVFFRPVASRIDDHAPAVPSAGDHLLCGTVVDVAYRGRGYDHVILVGPQQISAVHDAAPRRRGETVAVSVDPAHVLAYRADTDDDRVGT